MKKVLFAIVGIAILLTASMLFIFPKKDIVVLEFDNGVRVNAELAQTEQEKETGLMYRAVLPEGMFFVFNKEDKYSLWMQNVYYDLDAIWISQDLKVVYIQKMGPCKSIECPVYSPSTGAKYILEAPGGFTARNNIKIGSSLKIIR